MMTSAPRPPRAQGNVWLGILIVVIICVTQLLCVGIIAWAVK